MTFKSERDRSLTGKKKKSFKIFLDFLPSSWNSSAAKEKCFETFFQENNKKIAGSRSYSVRLRLWWKVFQRPRIKYTGRPKKKGGFGWVDSDDSFHGAYLLFYWTGFFHAGECSSSSSFNSGRNEKGLLPPRDENFLAPHPHTHRVYPSRDAGRRVCVSSQLVLIRECRQLFFGFFKLWAVGIAWLKFPCSVCDTDLCE